jgi:hypothetical protein
MKAELKSNRKLKIVVIEKIMAKIKIIIFIQTTSKNKNKSMSCKSN